MECYENYIMITSIDLSENGMMFSNIIMEFILYQKQWGLVNLSSRKLIAKKTDYKTLRRQNIDLVNFYSDNRYKNVKIDKFNSFEFYEDDFWFVSNGKIARIILINDTEQSFEYNPRNPNSFPNNISASRNMMDFFGLAASETGLYKYDLNNLDLIKHYQFDINDPNSLQTSIVTSLLRKMESCGLEVVVMECLFMKNQLMDFKRKILKSG